MPVEEFLDLGADPVQELSERPSIGTEARNRK